MNTNSPLPEALLQELTKDTAKAVVSIGNCAVDKETGIAIIMGVIEGLAILIATHVKVGGIDGVYETARAMAHNCKTQLTNLGEEE